MMKICKPCAIGRQQLCFPCGRVQSTIKKSERIGNERKYYRHLHFDFPIYIEMYIIINTALSITYISLEILLQNNVIFKYNISSNYYLKNLVMLTIYLVWSLYFHHSSSIHHQSQRKSWLLWLMYFDIIVNPFQPIDAIWTHV